MTCHKFCACGLFNEVITGCMILAMEDAGFKHGDIRRAVASMHYVLEESTAEDAETAFYEFS